MNIRAELKTYHNSLISNLAFYSREVALEVMSRSASYISKAIRASMRSKEHHWVKVSHYKVAFNKNRTQQLGVMEKTDGDIAKPGSLANFIGWMNYHRNYLFPTTVVGEAFQTHVTDIRRDGKVVGKEKVKGTGVRTMALIDRIDQGYYSHDYEKYFGINESVSDPKPYNFKDEGYRAALGDVDRILSSEWAKVMDTAMGRTELRAERITL